MDKTQVPTKPESQVPAKEVAANNYPWATIPIDRLRLIEAMNACDDRVKYKFGAKPNLEADFGEIKVSDCSGWARFLVHWASYGKVIMPDGSWNQHHWCEQHGFKETDYSNSEKHDNRLRVAFINAKHNEPGHIWFIINGQTIECYGGHGCGRRAWNAPIDGGKSSLDRAADACFVLTEPLV